MQNVDAMGAGISEQPKVNYLTNGFTLKSWLLTKDHKRIAIMYLIVISLFFLSSLRRGTTADRTVVREREPY